MQKLFVQTTWLMFSGSLEPGRDWRSVDSKLADRNVFHTVPEAGGQNGKTSTERLYVSPRLRALA